MSAAAGRDWFRSPTWDPSIAAEFERRLGRARPSSRAQYIRIQGSHLTGSPERQVREEGRGLLRRVVAEYPDDDLQTKAAVEQLGNSLADDGEFEEAEQALRLVLRMCADSPIGRSGTTGTTELRLAELMLAQDGRSRVEEIAELLTSVQPEVEQQKFFRSVVFRYLLASARLARLRLDPAARGLAREALAVAAETKPALPRHPDVGRPSPSPSELMELTRIAAGD